MNRFQKEAMKYKIICNDLNAWLAKMEETKSINVKMKDISTSTLQKNSIKSPMVSPEESPVLLAVRQLNKNFGTNKK